MEEAWTAADGLFARNEAGAPLAFDKRSNALVTADRADVVPALSGSFTLPDGRDELPGAAEAWPAIVERLKAMWRGDPGITLADLARLRTPVLFVAGDRDLVRTEHTVAMFEATPGAQLAIVPKADHRVPQKRAAEVAAIIDAFLERAHAPG